jgi:beta-glucosidase
VHKATSGPALYEATFSVKNTGARAGAAVPQLYVAAPKSAVPRPPKELKGFAKLTLQAGESRQVVLPLGVRSFAYFDVAAKHWRADPGTYRILIGDSSEQIALTAELQLGRALTADK